MTAPYIFDNYATAKRDDLGVRIERASSALAGISKPGGRHAGDLRRLLALYREMLAVIERHRDAA